MLPVIKIEVAQFQLDSQGYSEAFRRAVSSAVRLAARAFLLEVASRIPIKTGFLRGAFGTLENAVGSVVGGAIVPKTNLAVRKARLLKALEEVKRGAQRKKLQSSGKKRSEATTILNKKEEQRKAKEDKIKESLRKLKNSAAVIRHQDQSFKTGEYYYPNAVGRLGRRKGVHRGGAILKTTSSGQQFATPTSGIFSSSGSSWAFNYGVNIRYYPYNDSRLGWDSWRSAVDVYNRVLQQELRKVPSLLRYLKSTLGTNPRDVEQVQFGDVLDISETVSNV